MFDVKKISAMLLAVILAVACKDSDKKNELSSVVEEYSSWRASKYPGWRFGCPEGVGDAEWAKGFCNFGDGYENPNLVYVASTYALLSNPNFFDKKMAVTCGYLVGDITSWALYPNKEDALNTMFTNRLSIDTLELMGEFVVTEIFKHMELPYEMPACIMGTFSLHVLSGIPGSRFGLDFGFTYAVVASRYDGLGFSHLNKKLDSLLTKGENISDFNWSSPCEPFEIRKGKIKYVSVSPGCPIYESEYKK
jgi:hypothetical protein